MSHLGSQFSALLLLLCEVLEPRLPLLVDLLPRLLSVNLGRTLHKHSPKITQILSEVYILASQKYIPPPSKILPCCGFFAVI